MATDQRVPTGDGSTTASVTVVPSSPTTRFDKVDDPVGTPDDDSTYLYFTGTGYCLFTFSAFTVPVGATAITVKVYYRLKDYASGTNNVRAGLRVGGANYGVDAGVNPGASWANYSYVYTVNPRSTVAWTVDDVNGVGTNALQQFGLVIGDASPNPACTQVYAEVIYTPGGSTFEESAALAAVGSASADFSAMIFDLGVTVAALGAASPESGGSIYNPGAALAALIQGISATQADLLGSIILPALAAKTAAGGMSFEDAALLAIFAGATASAAADMTGSAALQAQAGVAAVVTALMDAGVSQAVLSGVTVIGRADLQAAFSLATVAALLADGELPGQAFYETISMAASAGTTAAALAVLNTLADLLVTAPLSTGTTAVLESSIVVLAAVLLSIVGEGGTSGEIAEVFIEIIRRRRGCR